MNKLIQTIILFCRWSHIISACSLDLAGEDAAMQLWPAGFSPGDPCCPRIAQLSLALPAYNTSPNLVYHGSSSRTAHFSEKALDKRQRWYSKLLAGTAYLL